MINLTEIYNEILVETKLNPKRFFLRNTNNPEADLKRGWSCNVNSWVDSEEDAIEFQKRNGSISKPKFDKLRNKWCADPELGLSSFSFYDEDSFKHAILKMEEYAHEGKIGLFISNDYILDVGLDSEDIFKSGKFLDYIDFETTYDDILKKV